MNENFKNRYTIQKILIANILDGIDRMGFQPAEGSTEKAWGVMEFAQASFNNADKIVLVDFARTNNVGFQGRAYTNQNGQALRTDDWLEDQTWMIHTIKRVMPSDVSDSLITCEDMADILVSWFNGQGAIELKNLGIGTLRIDQSHIFVYNDESELYQKRAAFPLRIQVPKEISVLVSKVSAWTSGIYPK